MPIQHGGAQRASLRSPIAGTVTWLRSPRPWLGALTLAILAPLAPSPVLLPGAVAAAPACGNWHSRITPPHSIRVLRTATGAVEEVHFATYVATVMASGEWPTSLPRAALEAGALAVKQYAWYYALQGNHRSSYRTRGGSCYDVRDDTMDQLYRPESARPTQKQLDALAATWALSVRKNDRFFLTGYRAGAHVGCARDADGWRLYAASVVACAKQGWSRQRILERYYGPHPRFVWDFAPLATSAARTRRSSDRRAPIALAPTVQPRKGATLGSTTGLVRWAGADAGSGLAGFVVQQRVAGGRWTDVALAAPRARSVAVRLDPTVRHEFRVRARDRAGNQSGWAQSVVAVPVIAQTEAAARHGTWSVVRDRHASDGSVRRARRSGAALSLSFRGRGVAIVAPTGRRQGIVRIRVSGLTVATIDLGALRKADRRIIWSAAWHTVRPRKVGLVVARVPGSEHVDVDGFVIIH